MKKLFSIFSIAAISFAAITSCAKEVQAPVEEEGINITIIGGDKDLNNDPSKTKTYVSEDGNTVHVYWHPDDKLRVYEVLDGGDQVYYATTKNTTILDGGKTAEFEASLSGSVTGEHTSYVYTAIYPGSCVSESGEKYRVLIPETQTLSNGTNLASDADVLIGAPIDKGNTRISSGDVLEYHFTRYGTTVKMTLKGITAGEKLRKVEIKAPVSISGYSYVNLLTGEITGRGGTNTTITLVIDDVEVDADGSIPVWFRVLSGTWHAINSNPIIIKAYTNDASYSKTIQSTTPDLVFAEGGLTTFGVGLGNRVPNPTIADGEYVIATKYNDKYYALSSIANGSRLARVDITEGFSAEKYTGTNYDIVWNLTTTPSGTAITTLNGEYLTYASSGASIGTTASYFQIAEVTADSQKYYNISTGSYYLEHNANQGGWYAFYTSVSATMINNLYLIPADVDKTPKIILDHSSVTLPCNTDSYDITFTKRFLAGEVTAEEASDPDNIVSKLSVEGNKVVVTVVPNTTSTEKTATINICSEADDIAETFTLTLEKYVATSTDVITADMLTATSSSYTAFTNLKKTGSNTINSEAVYAGSTAKNGNNIQMNTGTGRGIWTTASGGVVSSISVTYGNANGNTIKVYGKNSAFTSNSSSGASLIGTLSSNNLSVTADDDYEYILFIPNGGATYPASLSITWKPKATVTGIAVKTAPTTTEYHVGDKFNPEGLVITATYDDLSTKDIAYAGNENKFTFSPALNAALQTSDESVSITYGGKSTTQDINVYTWTYSSLVIANKPDKTTYWEGETFDKAGMVVNAHYVDNKSEIPNTKDEVVTDYTFSTDPLTAGTTSITLSKTINAVTKTANQEITVNARPQFTVVSSGSADPVIVSNVGTNLEGLVVASVTASEDLAWTASITAGDENEIILNTEGGVGYGNISIDCLANEGSAKNWTITVSTVVAGVLTSSYDIHVQQEAAEGKHSVQLANPSKPTYDNSTKMVSWDPVTKDVNGNNLSDYTPTYEVSVDNGNWKAATSPYSVSSLSVASHTIKVRAVGDGTSYDTSEESEVLEFTISNPQWKLVTDVSTLKSGDKITFYVNKTYTYNKKQYTAFHVTGTFNGSNLAGVDCKDKVSTDGTVISDLPSSGTYFTLGGNATNGWTLKLSSDSKYLYVSAKNKVATKDEATTWSITVDGSTKEVTVTQALTGSDAGNYYIQWMSNTSAPYFSAYKTSQTKVKMFRLE